MKKLTKTQIEKLKKVPMPAYKFNYSSDDHSKALDHQEYLSAVNSYNHALPALKYHLKTGEWDTWIRFKVSYQTVHRIIRHLPKILSFSEQTSTKKVLRKKSIQGNGKS